MKKWLIQKILGYPKTILLVLVGITMIFASFLEKPGLKFDNSTENIFPEHNQEVKYFHKFRDKFGSDEFLAIVLHPKGEKALMFTSKEPLKGDLNQGKITENILKEFGKHKISLSKKGVVRVIKKDREWGIDEGGDEWVLQQEKKTLKVYEKTVFTPMFLTYLKKLTRGFQKIQYVENVISLSSMKKPRLKKLDTKKIPVKKIFPLIMKKLTARQKETLLKAIISEQLKRKTPLPLAPQVVLQVALSKITVQERDELIEEIAVASLGKEPLTFSEEKTSQLLMKSIKGEKRKNIFGQIAQAQFMGRPLNKSQIFELVYNSLSSDERDELIRQLLASSLKGPERQVSEYIFFKLPAPARHKIFKEIGASQIRGEKITKGEVFRRAFKGLTPQMREEMLVEVREKYLKDPHFADLFQKEKVLNVVFMRLSPEAREAILSEIMEKYIQEEDLEPDKESLFRSFFIHIPPEKREEILKEVIVNFVKPGDFQMEVVDFFDHYPPHKEDVDRARELLIRIPPARGTVLPQKGLGKTAIVLQVKRPPENPEKALADIVKQVREILIKTKPEGIKNLQYYIAGAPAIKADILTAIKLDVATFVPITVFIIVLILFYLFRTVGAVLLPLLVIFVTDVWVLGLMAYFDYPLNTLTSLIISLMFVIGVADVVHLMAKYFDEVEKTRKKTESLEHMLDQLLLPCWITSFTTMVGFGSLMISDVEPIRNFGLFATIGTFLAFALTILLSCPIIQLFNVRREKPTLGGVEYKGVSGGLKIFFRISLYQWPVVIMALVVLVFSGWGITKMNVETNFVEFFKENSSVRKANDFVEKHFAGIAPLEITFVPKKGTLQDYEVLKRMDAFQTFLKKDSYLKGYIDQTTSVIDFYKFAHMVKMPNVEELLKPQELDMGPSLLDKNRYTLPETAEAYALDFGLFQKVVRLYDQAEQGVQKFLAHSLDDKDKTGPEWKLARISIRMKAVSSREADKVVGYIRDYAKKKFPQDDIHVTGTAALFAEAANSIVESQKSSFFLSIVVIFITMIVVFRSLTVGFLGMIPTILPIATTFGSMGWLGIPLNSSTSMVASISIGLAVDVAVHFISRFRLENEIHPDVLRALLATFNKTGKPILFTSAILMAGFLVLCLASFVPTIQFGILSCITIFSGLIAGLVVLPAVIFLIYRRKSPLSKEGSDSKI